jgi:hypothetical protein
MPRGSNFTCVTDAQFNDTFERLHGAEMRDYYARRPPRTGNTWAATVDALVMRGACRRTPAARGCE